jgi:hypothetical protein
LLETPVKPAHLDRAVLYGYDAVVDLLLEAGLLPTPAHLWSAIDGDHVQLAKRLRDLVSVDPIEVAKRACASATEDMFEWGASLVPADVAEAKTSVLLSVTATRPQNARRLLALNEEWAKVPSGLNIHTWTRLMSEGVRNRSVETVRLVADWFRKFPDYGRSTLVYVWKQIDVAILSTVEESKVDEIGRIVVSIRPDVALIRGESPMSDTKSRLELATGEPFSQCLRWGGEFPIPDPCVYFTVPEYDLWELRRLTRLGQLTLNRTRELLMRVPGTSLSWLDEFDSLVVHMLGTPTLEEPGQTQWGHLPTELRWEILIRCNWFSYEALCPRN